MFPSLCSMFTYNIPFNPLEPIGLFVDFLYFIHMPPAVHVCTYKDFSIHLWNEAFVFYVNKYAIREVYIIIDKPDFLPPSRSIVHRNRYDSKCRSTPLCVPNISDNENIFHGSEYAAVLGDQEYKAQLIKYLSDKFLEFAILSNLPVFSLLKLCVKE